MSNRTLPSIGSRLLVPGKEIEKLRLAAGSVFNLAVAGNSSRDKMSDGYRSRRVGILLNIDSFHSEFRKIFD
jgi:hypothetical protein